MERHWHCERAWIRFGMLEGDARDAAHMRALLAAAMANRQSVAHQVMFEIDLDELLEQREAA